MSTAVVAIIVAVVSGIISIWTNVQSKKKEHHLAVLKVLLEAGYKEYEFRAKQDSEEIRPRGQKVKIKSFTEYVIFYKSFAETFSKRNIKKEDIISVLKKNKVLIDTYYDEKEKYRPKYHLEA